MVAVHGKNTYVALDNATGTPVVISNYMKSAAVTYTPDNAETSGFGQSAKTYTVGMNDETIEVQGRFDVALHTQIVALAAALDAGTLQSATITIGPAGNATGSPSHSAECIIKSYAWTATTSDIVTVTLQLQRTGPAVDSTF